jgi:hypothetical protein
MDPSLSDFEELLRRSRPQPRADFVRELEQDLLRSVQPRARRSLPRLPRLLPLAAFAAAIAAFVIVLNVAGVLPLGGPTPGAKAGRKCVTVTEWRVKQVPEYRALPGGGQEFRLVRQRKPVSIIRCR